MSPEQCRGLEVDHRGDLYSVGVIWYELLTGKLPFTGSTAVEVMLKHAFDPPATFAAVGADIVPGAVESVVLSCLAKDPDQRPQSALELAERFETAWLDHEEASIEAAKPGKCLSPQELVDLSEPAIDPHATVYQMEARMPEAVAKYKLRSFIQDTGGELLEDVPGLIRVRLGGWTSIYKTKSGYKSWLGLRRKSGQIEMDLRMRKPEPQANSLVITILMNPLQGEPPSLNDWQTRCNKIYQDVRTCLMGRHLEESE
jgi:serine/threonine-protein kinase